MNKQIVALRRDELNKLIKAWSSFYKEPTIKLIKHLKSKNYTDKSIAQILDIDPSALDRVYLREESV